MKKLLVSAIFLSITYSQAGMFDQLTDIVSKETSKTVSENNLMTSITKNIDITPTQATSGVATILQYAKTQMPNTDYETVLKEVPALSNLNSSSLTDSLLGSITSLESVQTAFKTLGLDPSLISQFVPLIIDYAKSVGGVDSSSILTNALKGLV
ncbi:MAG: hypothetical protein C0626_07500 [Arcobacter sp.]|uniref:DUF2780 domain-containing protein n=1 Tax=uncultured Arcobacter sp. TaxID=165434 RepID=UPI000CA72E53|nr:DUF2780 domain-containing protein [uncultured Arcobacter sp.]PLY09906.1 MAG: hypothetical protein C0626_07500 [Arcobacter sp.]